jgi:branched-chain amino acid transport system substrate-binding protein
MSPSPSDGLLSPFKRYVFLLGTLYDEQAYVMIDYIIKDLKVKNPRIAVVYTDNESGKTLLRAVERYTELCGLNLVSRQVLNFGAVDAASQVMNLKKANADYVIQLAVIEIAAALLRDAKKYGLDATFFATMYGCDADTIKLAGKAAKNFMGVHSFSPLDDNSPGVVEMRKISLKYHPGKTHNRYYTVGWVAALLYSEAMKRSGKDLTGERLVDSLETIKEFDTKGLCGPITFSSKNHKALDSMKLYKADVDKVTLIPITSWRKPSRTVN